MIQSLDYLGLAVTPSRNIAPNEGFFYIEQLVASIAIRNILEASLSMRLAKLFICRTADDLLD